jgi:hypothetical protein
LHDEPVNEGVFLELLARGADASAFEEQVRLAAESGAGPERLAELERLRGLALRTTAVLERHERRESELAVLFETAQDLTRIGDVDRLLHAVVRRARRILAADVAYIALIDRDRRDTYMRVTDGMASTPIRTTRLPIGIGLGGLVAQDGVPYATSNFFEDDRFSHTENVDHAVRSEHIVAIVGVPLSVESDVVGVLYAADRHPREYQPEDIALLSSLAALSAVALDAANALEEARRAATELAASHAVADERARTLESISEAHRRMMQTVLEGGGVDDVAAAIAEILDGDVAVLDAEGLTMWSSRSATPDFTPAQADESAVDGDGQPWSGVTVAARGVPLVRVLVDRAELDAVEHGVLERGATALALVLVLGRMALDEEARSREELVVDLLAGVPMDRLALRRRSERSGLMWGPSNIVLVVRSRDDERKRIRAAVARWAPAGSVVAEYLQSTLVLLEGRDAGRAAKALAAHLRDAALSTAVGGAGPIEVLTDLRTSYDEASRCAELLVALGRGGGAELADLGLFGVLGVPEAADRAVEFVARALAPLIEYDNAHDGHLVETLSAYFTAERSRAKAAAALHVHVNTVGARLSRVASMLGADWSEGSRLLGIRMALELRPLLDAEPPQ